MTKPEAKDILADWVSIQIACHPSVPILLVSGSQGIGKSTALNCISDHFDHQVAVLGLDDFYLTKAERRKLGQDVHELFTVRGPAGTHDIALLNQTIDALLRAQPDTSTPIPVFDKRIDDRLPVDQWHEFSGKPKAIIVEGWCIGALPDESAANSSPMNAIEENDPDGLWRAYQESKLSSTYSTLWDRADAFFYLSAPSFDQVLAWRTEQEETTLGLAPGSLPEERRMWVAEFIQHYERVTRRILSGERCGGYSLALTKDRTPAKTNLTKPPLIVFSDLDGTLLDHKSYSFTPANEALDALKKRGAVLVLASSKTAAEMAGIRTEMGFAHCPAIVENGSGILEPGSGTGTDSAQTYKRLLEGLNSIPAPLRSQFTGFSDMSAGDIAAATGLVPDAAARAKQRGFSEPGTWSGTDEDLRKFLARLSDRGIFVRRGGRFITLSFGKTKADQMFEIASRYAPAPIIALGDAPNDAEMIAAANYGVIIKNAHGAGLSVLSGEARGKIQRTKAEGPAGWNRAVLDLLSKLNASTTQ